MALTVGPGTRIRIVEDHRHKNFVFSHTTGTKQHVFLEELTGEPLTLTDTQLLERWSRGEVTLEFSQDADRAKPALTADFTSYPEKDKAVALRRKKYVDAVRKVAAVGPRSAAWKTAIEGVPLDEGEKSRPAWQTIRPWHAKYIASGCDIRSLLPRFRNSGRKPAERGVDEQGFLNALIDGWLQPERPSREKFYRRVAEAYALARRKIPTALYWKEPGRSWLRRRLDRLDEREKIERRYGKKAASNLFSHTGTTPEAHYPLQVVEMDFTRLDLNVVDTRLKILLGRPWLTVLIDRYTRMLLGIYIGFEPPSVYSIAQCLANAIKPKLWINKLWPDMAGRWEAYGIPILVLVDNESSFASDGFADMGAALDMTIRFAPVRMPEYKAVVERFFRVVEDSCLSGLPGRTFSNSQVKGEYDAQAAATLTIDDFRRYFHFWMLAEYAWKTHSGIMAVPAMRWRKACKFWTPGLPKNVRDLDVHLGRRDTAVLTKKGVLFQRLRYQSEELQAWRRSYPKERDMILKVDDSDLGKLYVIHPKCPVPIPALAKNQGYANGLSLFAHKQILKALDAENKSIENSAEALAAKQAHFLLYEKLLRSPGVKSRAKLARNIVDATVQPNFALYDTILSEDVTPEVSRRIDAEMLAEEELSGRSVVDIVPPLEGESPHAAHATGGDENAPQADTEHAATLKGDGYDIDGPRDDAERDSDEGDEDDIDSEDAPEWDGSHE